MSGSEGERAQAPAAAPREAPWAAPAAPAPLTPIMTPVLFGSSPKMITLKLGVGLLVVFLTTQLREAEPDAASPVRKVSATPAPAPKALNLVDSVPVIRKRRGKRADPVEQAEQTPSDVDVSQENAAVVADPAEDALQISDDVGNVPVIRKRRVKRADPVEQAEQTPSDVDVSQENAALVADAAEDPLQISDDVELFMRTSRSLAFEATHSYHDCIIGMVTCIMLMSFARILMRIRISPFMRSTKMFEVLGLKSN